MSNQQQQTSQGSTSVAPSQNTNAALLLCVAGCGFFGAAKTNNYCSKCYKSHVPASPSTTPLAPPAEKKADSASSQPTSSSSSSFPATSSSSSSPAFLPLPPPSIPLPPMPSSSSTSTTTSPSASPALGPSTPTRAPSSAPLTTPSMGPTGSPGDEAKKKKTPRCTVCNSRLGLNFFQCKCSDDFLFCSSHRHPFDHKCSYDHRAQKRAAVATANPTVKGDKLADRL